MTEAKDLKKVRFEWNDGAITEFVGEDAHEWLAAVNSAVAIAEIHGMNQPLSQFWKKHGVEISQ